jgi:hypothetical protein
LRHDVCNFNGLLWQPTGLRIARHGLSKLMSMSRQGSFVAVLVAGVIAACSSPDEVARRTAIVVEVRSDLDVPDEIDEVRVEVSSISGDAGVGDGGLQSASGSLDEPGFEFPISVVLEPAPGVTSVRVVAEGLLDGLVVQQQVEQAEFMPNEIVVLRIDLDGPLIIDGGSDASADSAVNAGDDAGDSGACPAETCNGEDDDCDDRTDEGADICPQDLPFAVTACMPHAGGGASCQFVRCAEGQLRCDGDEGCETAISGTNCGQCGRACSAGQRCSKEPGDIEFSCIDGACPEEQPDVCGITCTSFDNSPQHCGVCDRQCGPAPDHAAPTCEARACALNCVGSFRSCDDQEPAPSTPEYTNGCEIDTNTDPAHCGRCDNRCATDGPNTIAYCEQGLCKTRCMDDFIECDDGVDGCETPIGDDDCYACDNACGALLQCCASQRDCCLL